jgi:hypothetical protein
MKRSSANPVKTLGGIDSYATSQDQFEVERYIRYNSDPIVPHSTITGIADVALRYHLQRTPHLPNTPLLKVY